VRRAGGLQSGDHFGRDAIRSGEYALTRLLRGVQGFILLEDADGNLEVLLSVETLTFP
jgi:hypothetical protein